MPCQNMLRCATHSRPLYILSADNCDIATLRVVLAESMRVVSNTVSMCQRVGILQIFNTHHIQGRAEKRSQERGGGMFSWQHAPAQFSVV